jgi:transcriptional regulator with XRE-family HTH domain
MKLLTVEDQRRSFKNLAVDKKALGKRIEHLRRDKFGTQAKLAKRAGVAANTVRGLEKGKLDTRGPQMDAILKALGTTLEELVRGENVQPSDPLLAGLNREDLHVARGYHDATTAMRQRVQSLLQDGEPERLTAIMKYLQHFSSEDLEAVETVITTLDVARQSLRDRKASQS